MQKKTYPALYPVKVGFSRVVTAGNYVFVSGCSGQTVETFHVDSDDVKRQTEVALEKIRSAIEDAGATMNDVVKISIYLTHQGDIPRVKKKMQEYYTMHAPRLLHEPPAETILIISSLHEPDLLVEIDCTAVQ